MTEHHTGDDRVKTTVKRLLWFAGLWVSGVLALGLAAYVLRAAIGL